MTRWHSVRVLRVVSSKDRGPVKRGTAGGVSIYYSVENVLNNEKYKEEKYSMTKEKRYYKKKI